MAHLGSKVYLRPQALTPTGAITSSDVENPSSAAPVKDETKRLRFSHHRTAFDVDIENLESHPWRTKNVDLSDYFNYGFTEATWQVNTFYIFLNLAAVPYQQNFYSPSYIVKDSYCLGVSKV
jgi:hypothetical protein